MVFDLTSEVVQLRTASMFIFLVDEGVSALKVFLEDGLVQLRDAFGDLPRVVRPAGDVEVANGRHGLLAFICRHDQCFEM